ncbi:MAG: hypothetical protein HYV07_16605 [Deltaproteobacteria bacterium]|nr:hypothetical protein [Deltaproteobacteria bacterium]
MLTELAGDAVSFQALTIGSYLAAVGVGGFWSERTKDPRSSLARIEALLVLVGAGVSFLVFGQYVLVKLLVFPGAEGFADLYDHAERARWVFVVSAELATATLGVLTGFELPLLLRWAATDGAPSASKVLAVSYAGALLGTLVFTFLLLPNLSAVACGVVVAVVVNGPAFVWLARARVPAIAWVLAVGACVALGPLVERLVTKTFYYGVGVERPGFEAVPTFAEMWRRPEIERARSIYQAIDLVESDERTAAGSVVELYLNGRIQVSPPWSALYHESLAHVPVQLFGRIPRRALVLGGGDGILARELLKYRGLESVTQVELDGRMIELAKTHAWFRALNLDALSDPRVTVVVDDAIGWLRRNRGTFDAVYIDFPDPVGYDLLKLYSVEIYVMIGWALADDGFLAMDVPIFSSVQVPLREASFRSWNTRVFSTLDVAGYRQVVPFLGIEHSFVAARKQRGPVGDDWIDHGIELEILGPELYRRARRLEFPHDLDPRKAVSIFWPPLSEFPDPVF